MTDCSGSGLQCLRLAAPLVALTSVALAAVAIATNDWLQTDEIETNVTSGDPVSQVRVRSVSGLWKMCIKYDEEAVKCEMIMRSRDNVLDDPGDIHVAIPNTVLAARPFLLVAVFILAVAEVTYALSHVNKRLTICAFIGGVSFVLSGLIMLVSAIVYIATFKSAVARKLRAASVWDPPVMTHTFGFSFISLVVSFITAKITGTLVIYIYIICHQQRWRDKNILNLPPPPARRLNERNTISSSNCRYNPVALQSTQFNSLPHRFRNSEFNCCECARCRWSQAGLDPPKSALKTSLADLHCSCNIITPAPFIMCTCADRRMTHTVLGRSMTQPRSSMCQFSVSQNGSAAQHSSRFRQLQNQHTPTLTKSTQT